MYPMETQISLSLMYIIENCTVSQLNKNTRKIEAVRVVRWRKHRRTLPGSTIRLVKGWQQRERQNNTSEHAARVLDRNLTGYFIPFFSIFHWISAMRKRARDAQEASEGSARPIVRDQDFSWCDKGKTGLEVGFLDGCRCCWQRVRREKRAVGVM